MDSGVRRFGTIDTHTAGEPTRIVTAGIELDGAASIVEYRDQFQAEYDWVRELLLKEPRGHADMFGAVPVFDEGIEGDVGVVFMDTDGYLDMCGHGTIGLVTALIETGALDDGAEVIRIGTPAGVITAHPHVNEGRVESVRVENVGSFVYDRVTLEVPEVGVVSIDVVFAGNVFALVDAGTLEIDLSGPDVSSLIRSGQAIKASVNAKLEITDPMTGEPRSVGLTEFYWSENGVNRNVTVFGDGMVDRSPCGTGTCAKMAALYESGDLDIGESFVHESVIGTQFTGEITGVAEVDGRTVVTPVITGSAFVTGTHEFVLDPADPITGFTIPFSR